jgi:TRAP-type transport system periplasmic protein
MFSAIVKPLKFVAVAASLAWTLAPTAGFAQTKLLIGNTGTPGNSVYVVFDEFAKRVEKYSNGSIKPEVHHSGELGGDDQLLQSLKLGTVDMASAATGNMGSMTKALLFADLPYIFGSRDAMEKVFSDPEISAKLASDIERDIGTKVLGYVQAGGYRMLENRRRALKTPADVKGLKFRTTASPLDVALIQAWGGLPSQVAWAETFTAVQQGVVDGLNLQPVWTALNGFGQVIKYATRNNAVMTLHCIQKQ